MRFQFLLLNRFVEASAYFIRQENTPPPPFLFNKAKSERGRTQILASVQLEERHMFENKQEFQLMKFK